MPGNLAAESTTDSLGPHMRHTHSWCAGAPFVCGSFLVFIALIVGLFIRQGEVHQSEAGSRLQEPLLGDHSAHADECLEAAKRHVCGTDGCATAFSVHGNIQREA